MKLKKFLALLLTLSLLFTCLAVAATAQAQPAFTIGNPYAGVNWDTAAQYKTQLHVHSSASDGDYSIAELVEEHYRLGYDIMAITDHGTIGVRWDQAPRIVPYLRLLQMLGVMGGNTPRDVLTTARRQEILTGVGRDGRGMMEVTGAIELKPLPDSHINAFWAGNYGQGLPGLNLDYRTHLREVDRRGGVAFINHPGRVTGADELTMEQALAFYAINTDWPSRYAQLLLDHPSLLGFEINSKNDTETRNDRLLYDAVLQMVIPHGRTPWMFSTSDAHRAGEFDRGWSVMLLEEKTPAALRTAMETGTFFGVNRYARNEAGYDFAGTGQVPVVSRITVDTAAYTITIDASYYDRITWVADGVEIHTGAVLNIADFDDEIGVYVRAYVLGPGGILYVQPFTVLRAGQTWESLRQPIPRVRDIQTCILRTLVSIFGFIRRWVPPVGAVWRLLTQFDPAHDFPTLWGLFH